MSLMAAAFVAVSALYCAWLQMEPPVKATTIWQFVTTPYGNKVKLTSLLAGLFVLPISYWASKAQTGDRSYSAFLRLFIIAIFGVTCSAFLTGSLGPGFRL